MDALHHLLKYRYDSLPGIILGLETRGPTQVASFRVFTGQRAHAAVASGSWRVGEPIEVRLAGCGGVDALLVAKGASPT